MKLPSKCCTMLLTRVISSIGVNAAQGCSLREMTFLFLTHAGLTPIKLFLDERHVRAWPGGVGDCKMGSNYAPTILPQAQAFSSYGTPQVLYTLPPADRSNPKSALISESGAMNVFFHLHKVAFLTVLLIAHLHCHRTLEACFCRRVVRHFWKPLPLALCPSSSTARGALGGVLVFMHLSCCRRMGLGTCLSRLPWMAPFCRGSHETLCWSWRACGTTVKCLKVISASATFSRCARVLVNLVKTRLFINVSVQAKSCRLEGFGLF